MSSPWGPQPPGLPPIPPEKPPAPVIPPDHTPTSGLKLDQAIVEQMLWLRKQLIHSGGQPGAFYHLIRLDIAALDRELGPDRRRELCLAVWGVAQQLNPADEVTEGMKWDFYLLALDLGVRLRAIARLLGLPAR